MDILKKVTHIFAFTLLIILNTACEYEGFGPIEDFINSFSSTVTFTVMPDPIENQNTAHFEFLGVFLKTSWVL